MINIYSDKHQLALKYLKDTEVNVCNILIIAEDFNIKDRDWDHFYPHHLAQSNILIEIANSLELKLSSPVYQVPI